MQMRVPLQSRRKLLPRQWMEVRANIPADFRPTSLEWNRGFAVVEGVARVWEPENSAVRALLLEDTVVGYERVTSALHGTNDIIRPAVDGAEFSLFVRNIGSKPDWFEGALLDERRPGIVLDGWVNGGETKLFSSREFYPAGSGFEIPDSYEVRRVRVPAHIQQYVRFTSVDYGADRRLCLMCPPALPQRGRIERWWREFRKMEPDIYGFPGDFFENLKIGWGNVSEKDPLTFGIRNVAESERRVVLELEVE